MPMDIDKKNTYVTKCWRKPLKPYIKETRTIFIDLGAAGRIAYLIRCIILLNGL